MPPLESLPTMLQQADPTIVNDWLNRGVAIAALVFIAWFSTKHIWPFAKEQVVAIQGHIVSLQMRLMETVEAQASTNAQIVALLADTSEQMRRMQDILARMEAPLQRLADERVSERKPAP
ncbi:MAG: hypothetical protein KC418_21955 [Anaerolineales bacterium]|nr:hypothetical protein [Anaerolineales bacterium]